MATTFTARDMELLLAALSSTKSEFAIDYTKFAECAKLKNKDSAQVTWGRLKKKLDAMRKDGGTAVSSSSGVTETLKSTPKSTKGSKRKAIAEIDADDEEILTPSASKGKRSCKAATPAKEDEEALTCTEDGVDGVKAEPED